MILKYSPMQQPWPKKDLVTRGSNFSWERLVSPPSKPLRPTEVLADGDSEVNLKQMVGGGGGVVGNEYQLQPLYDTVMKALVYYSNFSFIRFTQEES